MEKKSTKTQIDRIIEHIWNLLEDWRDCPYRDESNAYEEKVVKYLDELVDKAREEGKREGYAEGIVDAVRKLNPETYQLLEEFVGEYYKVIEEILKLLNK